MKKNSKLIKKKKKRKYPTKYLTFTSNIDEDYSKYDNKIVNVNYYIGTSGFMTSKKKWTDLNTMNCIEINATFYRLPTKQTISNWEKEGEYKYSYVIKASRYITHIKRLKQINDEWKRFWDTIKPLTKRLNAILFQMPPTFKFNYENLQRIFDLYKYINVPCYIVFEFRNIGWFRKEVYTMFLKFRWCMCSTFIKKKKDSKWMGSMPNGILIPPKTCDINYIRIHGKKGYQSIAGKYYLKKIKYLLEKQNPTSTFVMFNNTFFEKKNKRKIKEKNIDYAAIYDASQFSSMVNNKN